MIIWVVLKSLKKNYLENKSFTVCWLVKNSDKGYEVVKGWNRFEIKPMEDYHDLSSKSDLLSLADLS